ncbi:hypothetical protein FACS189472_18660 [Alphaproteobacteria bacterium]|nr:hypothetical protein FACS189472_18660 [Alphaproteobacteria bacterium]
MGKEEVEGEVEVEEKEEEEAEEEIGLGETDCMEKSIGRTGSMKGWRRFLCWSRVCAMRWQG